MIRLELLVDQGIVLALPSGEVVALRVASTGRNRAALVVTAPDSVGIARVKGATLANIVDAVELASAKAGKPRRRAVQERDGAPPSDVLTGVTSTPNPR